MSSQSFAICQSNNNWAETSKAVGSNFLGSDVLLERLGVDTTELTGISVRGQCVVRSRGVVAAAAKESSVYLVCDIATKGNNKPLRRVSTHKDTPGILHLSHHTWGIQQMQDQMLRSIVIGEFDGFFD